jgi:hypothetical protein
MCDAWASIKTSQGWGSCRQQYGKDASIFHDLKIYIVIHQAGAKALREPETFCGEKLNTVA